MPENKLFRRTGRPMPPYCEDMMNWEQAQQLAIDWGCRLYREGSGYVVEIPGRPTVCG